MPNEASHDLAVWHPLPTPHQPDMIVLPSSGWVAFNDEQAQGYTYRFYRVRSGQILSYNALGYMTLEVPPGDSMIANQLDHPDGNTVEVLLPDPPEGTTLYKFSDTSQNWSINTFDFGSWSNPTMPLNPGGGIRLRNVAGVPLLITFAGEVRQGPLVNSFPSNLSVRSSMVPQVGRIDADLGFLPEDGDEIHLWNFQAQDYDIYTYSEASGWQPETPVAAVGESFFISTGTAREWIRIFTVW